MLKKILVLTILGLSLSTSVKAAQEKVNVCHVPPGNPEMAHFISVGFPSANAHAKNHEDDILSSGDETCIVGVGECAVEGLVSCTSGGIVCDLEPTPPPEETEVSCSDGLDNDCDGFTDSEDPDCRTFPEACETGSAGRRSGAPWVVCRADANTAWVSAGPGGGVYDADQACKALGYLRVMRKGGTCGSVCGYCESSTSCAYPGREVFDNGGPPLPIIYYTVQWQCTNY